MKHYELLIFDWDGTLCDSIATIVEAMQMAAVECDLEKPSAQAVQEVIGLGLDEAIVGIFGPLSDAKLTRCRQFYSDFYINIEASSAPLFSGARQTLDTLLDHSRQLAIATGKSRRGLDRVLAAHDLKDRFHYTRCSDESGSKPAPGMIYDILVALKVSKQSALMIGDTSHDLIMAEAAGIDSVAVSFGSHCPVRLLDHNPIAVIHSLPQLLQLLQLS